jgi:CheY-like chemotaxis protein
MPDPGNLQGVRVLCVHNDGAILNGIEALLGQWGAQVLKARNSAEAAILCDQSSIDTVLADYHLAMASMAIELPHRLCATSFDGHLHLADRRHAGHGLPVKH